MGSAGKKRKGRKRLPKVRGNPGRLWTADDAVPWSYGDKFLRSVGRAGPSAQERYFRGRRGPAIGAKALGIALGASVVVAIVAVAVR